MPPPPPFFRILLDPSAPHLSLPPDFVAKHLLNEIPKNPIIRSANGDYIWRLKITKIGDNHCFSHGWSNVVKDIGLTFGDFLIFRLVDQSAFKVLIYSPNGCVKVLPSKIKVEPDSVIVDADADNDTDTDENDDVGVEVVDDEEQEEEEDDDVEEDDDDEEEDDEEEDEDEDDVEEDEEQIEYADDDDDDDGNDEDEEDGGGDIDGPDGDPFFSSIISTSHKSVLRLPAEFVKLAGIDEGMIRLKNVDGQEWETRLLSEKSKVYQRYYVSKQWPDFRRTNDLLEGDECVFKFIRSEGTLLLAKVARKKRRPRYPPPSDETPATESATRKRGRPQRDDGVPASEDVKRKKVSPPSRRAPASADVKRKTESPPSRPRRGVPASEDIKRKKKSPPSRPRRGVPASDVKRKKESPPPRRGHGVPANEVVKGKKEIPPPSRRSRGAPAAEVVKRKKGPVEVVVKRTRGRQDGRRCRTRKAK